MGEAAFDYSRLINSGTQYMYFENVALKGMKIVNANLSLLEIDGAQMGGAYIHNSGVPKSGEPHFHPDTAGQTVRFEKCNFTRGRITDCISARWRLNVAKCKG
jgi:hypothetical protein